MNELKWKDVKVGEVSRFDISSSRKKGYVYTLKTHRDGEGVNGDGSGCTLSDETTVELVGKMQASWWNDDFTGFTIPAEILNEPQGKAGHEIKTGTWFIRKGCSIKYYKAILGAWYMNQNNEPNIVHESALSVWMDCLPYTGKPPFVISDGDKVDELQRKLDEVNEMLDEIVTIAVLEGYPESTPNAAGQLVSTEPTPLGIVDYLHTQYLKAKEDTRLLDWLLGENWPLSKTSVRIKYYCEQEDGTSNEVILKSRDDIRQAMGERDYTSETWNPDTQTCIKDEDGNNYIVDRKPQPPQDHGQYQPLVDAVGSYCTRNVFQDETQVSIFDDLLDNLPTPDDTINVPKKFVEDVRELLKAIYTKTNEDLAFPIACHKWGKVIFKKALPVQSTLNEMGGEGDA